MSGLQGKNVFITGASTGIGRAIAVEFAREGSNIAINYRKDKEGAEETEKLVKAHNVKSFIIQGDVDPGGL